MPETPDPFGSPLPVDDATPVDRDAALADLEAPPPVPPAGDPAPTEGGRSDEDRRLDALRVDLPSGGQMVVFSAEEVDLWRQGAQRYIDGHGLTEHNDLMQVTAALQAGLSLYRANQLLSGLAPRMDPDTHRPTGSYEPVRLNDSQVKGAHERIKEAISQIQSIDKALGVDRRTRDGGNKQSVANYIADAKAAAAQYAIHVAERTLAYEEFAMGLRWRHRVLTSHDAEDRKEHNLTPESFIAWAGEELKKLEQVDIDFAHQKGRLIVGVIR